MAVRAIPEGYGSVTPYLIVKGGARAIDYYKKVFGATELMRFDGPDGHVSHAEIQIGSSRVMLADEYPDMGFRSPQSLGGSGTGLMLYVDDVDRVFMRAVEGGANVQQAVKDQFRGFTWTSAARSRPGALSVPGRPRTLRCHPHEGYRAPHHIPHSGGRNIPSLRRP